MDWHSSGITTSVIGALKRGLNPRASDLGLYVCGGRGRHSRQTPSELLAVADRRGFDGMGLVRASRLTAKIDNNCIADGFQIYLHSFVVAATGEWAVVQQGMNEVSGMARRYHWHSASVRDFVSEPHTGIVGEPQGSILNLVDAQAQPAREALLTIAHEQPDRTLEHARRLVMPRHHDVRREDVDLKRLGSVLAVAHDRDLKSFADLLLVENLGPRTLQTLAMVAEVVHARPAGFEIPRIFVCARRKGPAPFSGAAKEFDESIEVLRRSVDRSRIDGQAKSQGLQRLHRFVCAVEEKAKFEANLEGVVAHELAISSSLNGRSVFDYKPRAVSHRQLKLF